MSGNGLPAPLAIASENWIPVPALTGRFSDGIMQISFSVVPGYAYATQYAAGMSASNKWTVLNVTTGVGGATVIDPQPESPRYYRVLRRPAP